MAVDLNGAAEAAAETSRAVLAVLPQGAPGRDHAEKTLETVQRCAELARHLLRMSTRYMGQSSRIDVSALVRQQEALLQHLAGPDIELQFDLTGGLSSAELDAQEVTQVLTSLTVTARDALPLGGAIRITTTSQRHDPVDAAPRAPNRYARWCSRSPRAATASARCRAPRVKTSRRAAADCSRR